MSAGSFFRNNYRIFSTLLLWAGLVLCGYAVWKLGAAPFQAIGRLHSGVLSALTILVSVVWLASVAAWRQYLRSFTGRVIDWRDSFRQIGLLLIGKYIPGGIFGFVARLYDEEGAPRGRLLAAGLIEQLVGGATATLVGGVCYAAAWYKHPALLFLIVVIPLLAMVGVDVFGAILRRSVRLHRRFPVLPNYSRPHLFVATLHSLMQQLSWALAVGLLAVSLFGLDVAAATGIAGAFGLAVGVGVLVVISPGGIGVREGAMIALSSAWLGFESALLLAALLRLISVCLDLIAGLVVLVLRKNPSTLEGT